MKKSSLFFIFSLMFFILLQSTAFAVNPLKKYNYLPSDFGLQYSKDSVWTNDGYQIAIWKIGSKGGKNPILLAYGDSGNMGEWLGVAAMFSSLGHEVWMFDYRGFGNSDDFQCSKDMLFYADHYQDLKAVIDYMSTEYEKFNILSFSMSTLFVLKYLSEHPNSPIIRSCILDGLLRYPHKVVSRIYDLNGKIVSFQKEIESNWDFKTDSTKILIIQASQDIVCKSEDIADIRELPNVSVLEFDCGHNQAIFTFTEDYYRSISPFL